MNIVVGVSDMKASNDPTGTLVTYSLGSCIGVAIYDPVAKAGGLLHFMLPESSLDPEKASTRPFMFADSGIPRLFKAVYKLGGEALSTLDENWLDLVLTDYNMPDMDGLMLLKKMKADDCMKTIPVVMVTTEGSHERVDDFLAHEIAADFLGVDVHALARDDVRGTLMEMVNMLAGNTLSHYDADLVFDLSVPRMIDDDAGPISPAGQAGHCCLDIQTLANHISLVVNYEGQA